jgi:hypothetical protein
MKKLLLAILLAPLSAFAQPPEVQVSIAPGDLVQNTGAIPEAFAGLDLPLADVTTVIGDSNGLNPRFVNLLKNLTVYATNGHMRVRIGNDTLAWTGQKSPQKDRIPVLAQLAREFNVSYLLGVDFKSDNLAATASAISALTDPVSGLPAKSIESLELGNEADLYQVSSQADGAWNAGLFSARFAKFAGMSGKVAAPVWAGTRGPFFGPRANDPLGSFIAANAANIKLVDMHQYYGSNCHGATLSPGDLLKPVAATKAQAAFQPHIAAAHAYHLPFVLSEWNSASCGGIAGVSDTFESALWTLDGLFEWLKVGLDGVTLTTGINMPYSPWQVRDTGLAVAPNFYGVRMFLQATQDSARRVNLSLVNKNSRNMKAWATIDAHQILRVVLINKDRSFNGPIDIAPGAYAAPVSYILTAPEFNAVSGLSYAGQTFDNSVDGNPVGKLSAPQLASTAPGHFSYNFSGVGAVLLEFKPAR